VIDYQSFCKLRQLHDVERLSIPQIALELGLHRETVAKWISRPTYEQRRCERPRTSKLDPFKASISHLLARHDYTASQIHSLLREEGYQGGPSILRSYVARVRPRTRQAFLRLQFAPGQAAQIDWGSAGYIQVGNTRCRLSFFVIVLCYSRRMYVEFTLRESQEHFLTAHRNAFLFFGGVPAELIVDNCKVAVLEHRRGEEPKFNPRYLDFARHHGCRLRACNPLSPQEKGRVERAVGYVKHHFLAGRQLGCLDAINAEVRLWMNTVANVRIHGETGQAPDVLFGGEKLQTLNPNPYDAATLHALRSGRTCRVQFDSNTYSVPARHARESLVLKAYTDRIQILDGEQIVAEHPRCYERRRDFELPGHVEPLLHQRLRAHRQRQLIRFLTLGPAAQAYYEGLCQRRPDALVQVQRIVALAESHGEDLIARLLEDLLQLQAFGADYLANLVTQRQRHRPEPSALHLTRASDLLDLEVPAPDLSLYHQP
jgi:transposase